MQLLTIILIDLYQYARFLLILLLLLPLGLALTYSTKFQLVLIELYQRSHLPEYSHQRLILQIRRQLILLLILVSVTIIYWAIDTHVATLPDPVVPYVFIVLIACLLFGVRFASILAVLSIGLNVYFLFEPRYSFNLSENYLDLFFTILGTVISLLIGSAIRSYQLRLLYQSDELRLLVSARDKFASIAAHELKTPITTIKLYSQTLQQSSSPQKISTTAQTIDKESDKMLAMVNLLLDFSKLQTGKMQLNKTVFDIQQLCKQRIIALQAIYPNHHFTFQGRLKSAPILADEISVDRVITNLLTNAAKYSPSGTTISLSLKKTRLAYSILVKDQGIGISNEQTKKLFEPFFQVDSNQGLGLGLYITKSLIELHRGSITVESILHQGSTFIVTIPVE